LAVYSVVGLHRLHLLPVLRIISETTKNNHFSPTNITI